MKEDFKAPIILRIVCFFVPIVGLILFCCNISENKTYAKSCGIPALISTIISVCMVGIMLFLGIGIAIYNNTGPAQKNILGQQEAAFNRGIEQYGGNITGDEVEELIEKINRTNKTTEFYVIIYLNEEKYSKNMPIDLDATYRVSFEKDWDGIINEVHISNPRFE